MPIKGLSETDAGNPRAGFENMLQECVACGLLACDSEGTILALTPEAERALHLRVAGASDRLELPERVQAVVREVLATGRAIADRRVALGSSAADPALIVTALPVDWAGKSGVVVLTKDIRPGKQIEQNLERLDRLASVGLLAAGMTHEIRNALVAIKTFVDLLLEKNKDPDLAEVVRREVGRVDSIVSRMLRFAGPAQPALATIRLHDVLDHALRLVEHRVDHKLISFTRNLSAAPDVLTGDDRQLEQAFVNILFNALEAMSQEGTLAVSTELVSDDQPARLAESGRPSSLLRIRISDTGVGIPPDNVDQIFEPFFTTKPNGTGLGLAVTRRIIQDHHGAIHVESSPGKGTTFVILLPAG